MPTASLYVAVKRQLVSVLQERLPSTQVDYAWLRGRALDGGKTPGEHVWLENLPDLMPSTTPVLTGQSRHPRNEQFRVGVNCQVADGGEVEPDVVETRALDLLAAVDGALADDKQLGITDGSLLEARLSGWQPLEPQFEGKGWAFRFQAEVWFNTWLT